MRKLIIIIIGLTIAKFLYSQESEAASFKDDTPAKIMNGYKAYAGMSTGINNFNSVFGVFAEYNIINNITINGGVGLGMWGTKASLGVKFYKNYPRGAYYGLSASGLSGGLNDTIMAKTVGTEERIEVVFQQKQSRTLNFTVGYYWVLSEGKIRLHFEGGYSFPLVKKSWEILTPNIRLTKDEETLRNFWSPGGIVLAFGTTFGF